MFKQSPRKYPRSVGMKTKPILQVGLVLGVFIWLFVHGSDKKESPSQQNSKFSEKMQQHGNDKVFKLGRKDLKPKRDAYNEDEKPMDVQPLERPQFDDETKPEETVNNNIGTLEHIENYANNLKETEGGVSKDGKDGEVVTLDKVEEQENTMGTDHIENFANNMKETETEEGSVAKDGEMGTLEGNEVKNGRGNGNSDDQKMDGGEKDVVIDIKGGDNFNKIDDKKFQGENNEHDAGKDDGEHIESDASIKMKTMSKTDAGISDGESGQQKAERKEDTNGETSVDNDSKGNEHGETTDGKSEGTLEENENGNSKIADSVKNELVNELGELMKENLSKVITDSVIKEKNKGKGVVSENSQQSAGDEVSMEQKLEGKMSENSHKSGGDELPIEHEVGQESNGTSLVEGKIIDTSDKSSKNIQENDPDAGVASKNGTEIEKGSSIEPEKTKSKKKKVKHKKSHHTKTLTKGNKHPVSDDEQQVLDSIEKLNMNDEKSNLSTVVPSTKTKVANSDPMGSGKNAEPKTSRAMAERSGMEERQNETGTNAGQSRMEKPSIFSSSSMNEINKLDVPHTSTNGTKPDENLASVSDSNATDASTQRRIKILSHITSSSNVEETETLSHDTSSSNGDDNAEEKSEKTAEETPANEVDSSSGSLSQEEKEAHNYLDILPESETSNNNASE